MTRNKSDKKYFIRKFNNEEIPNEFKSDLKELFTSNYYPHKALNPSTKTLYQLGESNASGDKYFLKYNGVKNNGFYFPKFVNIKTFLKNTRGKGILPNDWLNSINSKKIKEKKYIENTKSNT